MASSDDINIQIKVDTSDVPKAEKQVSTFEKMVEQAVSRMKQALSLKVDTSGVKEAMSAVKSLNSSLSSPKTNIKLAADTSGIQPAVSAVKNLESSAAKPVTVKTAANTSGIKPAVSAIDNLKSAVAKPVKVVTSAATTGIQSAMYAVNNLKSAASKPVKVITSISGNAASAISAIKSNIASIPKKITSVVSANDGGTVSKLASGFQTLGAKAKSVADGVMNIGTLARSSLPSVDSAASSSSNALSSVGSAASDVKSRIADIGESASSASGDAGKLHGALQNIASVTMTGVAMGIGAIGHALKGLVKDSYNLLSTSQQVAGGVEALYGDAADSVKKNAKAAFETAGMSANRYMDIATSLGAVMTNSVGGDAKEAARLMDMAVRDMSDNANKMGTDMESVIGTYQSLSRGNYAMLDNLKLGYGGTKAELQRLIDDTNKYRDANNQLSADKFSDIVEAIHATQERLHILGTTSNEAATTIEGSFNQMKAAWENWKTDIGKGDIGQIQLDSENLVASFKVWVDNARPAIIGILKGLVQAIPSVFDDLKSLLPQKLQGALSSISGVADSLSPILAPLGAAFAAFGIGGISPLLKNIPLIGDSLAGLIGPLTALSSPLGILIAAFAGLVATSPELQEALGSTLTDTFNSLKEPLSTVWDSTQKLLTSLGEFVNTIMPPLVDIIKAALPIIQEIATFIGGVLLSVFDLLLNAFNAIMPVLTDIANAVLPAVKDAIQLVGDVIKEVIDAAQPIIEAIFNLVKTWFDEYTTNIAPLLEAAVRALVPMVQDVIKSVREFLDALKPYIKAFVDNVVSWINNVLVPIVKNMVPVIQNVIVAVTRVIHSILTVVKNVINFVTAILKGDWKGAWEAAKGIVSGVIDGIKNIIGGAINIGKSLVTGIWRGISGAAGWLWGKVSGWAKGLVDKVKGFFKIGSPSKVFAREIGRFIPQGISVGINADTDSVLDSLRGLKTRALNEVSDMRMMSTYSAYDSGNADSYSKVPTYIISGNQGYSMPLPSNKSQSDSPYQSGQPVILQVNLNGKTIAKETYKDITYLQKRDTSRGM